jgi:hypothetical protein
MARVWTVWLLVAGLGSLGACSGKTERGIGGDAPATKPAAGPSNVSGSNDPELPAKADDRRHVLLVVELQLATGGAKVLKSRPVDLPLPRKRGPVARGPWQVDVLDAAGAVLFTAPLADSSTLRGEVENPDGQLSGVHTQKQVAAVALRLPILKDGVTVRISRLDEAKGPTELGSVAYPKVQP